MGVLPLNYHHLYYFWSVAKAGSMTAARQSLLLSQPALSLQIRQLEKFLGKRLLYRGRKGVSLTPDGRLAFDHCERIFRQGEALLAALRDGGKAPVLRLAVTPSIPGDVVLQIIDLVRASSAESQTMISTGPSEEIQERLRRHAADLIISDREPARSLAKDFRCRVLRSTPLQFVAAPHMAKELKGFPRKGQTAPFLVRPAGSPIRRELERWLRSRGVRVVVEAESPDPQLLRILAVRGRGVTALDPALVRADIVEGRLVPLGRLKDLRENAYLIASCDGPAAGAAKAIIDRLMDGLPKHR